MGEYNLSLVLRGQYISINALINTFIGKVENIFISPKMLVFSDKKVSMDPMLFPLNKAMKIADLLISFF